MPATRRSRHKPPVTKRCRRGVVGGSIRHIESMSREIGVAATAVAELAHQVASIDQVLAVIRGISEPDQPAGAQRRYRGGSRW